MNSNVNFLGRTNKSHYLTTHDDLFMICSNFISVHFNSNNATSNASTESNPVLTPDLLQKCAVHAPSPIKKKNLLFLYTRDILFTCFSVNIIYFISQKKMKI